MNLFSTELFLETAGELFYPSRRRRIETFDVQGRALKLLVLDRDEVVQSMPFYDFPQPLEGGRGGRSLPYFPRSVVRTVPVSGERVPEPEGHQPSPYIDWSTQADFAAFEAMVEARGGTRSNDSKRQRRRIEKDLGPISFVYDDPRPEVFDACVKWKSGQYLATGVGDMFAKAENVELFRRLKAKGALVVTSFSAGSTLMATHLGGWNQGWFGWWIPAYDPSLNKYSPGRLLLEDLIRESHARKHTEFDFLIGDEKYKFTYATHNRVVGPLGTPPLRDRLVKEAKKRAKALLSKYPQAYALARSVRKRLRA
ncbi:MAG: GNAT family N-acetyltransferase [Archangiaceae bacterium]|nr:GNAT family N-acetyltransferase [Archangiaceae bacterium]